MRQGICPECAAGVPLREDTVLHEFLTCPECGTALEVISLSPVTLERAPQVEEDWGE